MGGSQETSLSADARQEHDARQHYDANHDYGDSLLYNAGNADWRGFDEGVEWDGIALQDRDVARRDDALRNRGGARGDSDFGGSARDVEGRAGAPADSAGRRKRRSGAHRVPAPPRALKGRAAVIAVAAGAIVAAGQNLAAGSEKSPQTAELQAVGQQQALEPVSGDLPTTPELLDTATPTNLGQFSDVLENGDKFAQDLAAEVEAKLRPLFTKFASGTFTSGYGERWGVLHPGVDVAAPIGTPIYAVEDGTVIDAGPAAGFGMWVRMRGDDGTVTVYGHINTALVSVGQHVIAGDEIATVGNRGESTGPHCHFEVWLNGTDRIDPLPWLATRGISLGQERD
ncbi:M23 family metallopeptidase [Nocardia pseudovaccinii]|uniref:M23 family metallopeptidase n=1 Tax=Nocardia pseudovaccinii TaxID=189540 RepID=UPI003D8C2F9A